MAHHSELDTKRPTNGLKAHAIVRRSPGHRAIARSRAWPGWPRSTPETERLLLEVAHSGRWTVSGAYTGQEPYERRFARAFADYIGTPYSVPTCHGSSSLVVALEALDVGSGDEVLVPGLTWVACASAVVRAGATPILVDIDPATLCMDAEAARAQITDRTRAIMVVHLFCSVADLDAFTALSEATGIPLLEDCSQAHGARWRGQHVGSFGAAAAFSFQQTKLLTAGEGGAVTTSSASLYDRMQQLRADGRRWTETAIVGQLDLEEVGEVNGHNYCLTEFQAAVLLEGLQRLDAENALRRANARYLKELLAEIDGVDPIVIPEQVDEETYYHFCMRLRPDAFGGRDAAEVGDLLTAALDLHVEAVDRPLNDNPLYNPLRSPRIPTDPAARRRLDPRRFDLPTATNARATCITFPHRALLGGEEHMARIARALADARLAAWSCA
jgi:dTDP-4-amino-4,6-dideoxygalactose transaminase